MSVSPWFFIAGLAASSALQAAGPQSALVVPVDAEAKLEPQAAFVAQLLQKGGSVYFRLPGEALPSRDAKGQWRKEALQAAVSAQGPVGLAGDVDGASKGLDIETRSVDREGGGRWLIASGLPQVTLIQDSSTISPLSKGLDSWHWPYKVASYASVESDPGLVLNPVANDLVVFSSPGWWDDFANPPGGPSRLSKKVADALRDYVRQGGTALFIDIAQWDLEKTWPQTLDLNPLGPYQVSHLILEGGYKGGASLSPVGVATDRLSAAGAFSLLGDPNFDFPDGQSRALIAAYGMPDPGGGQGWVAGLALHVFEQDESLAPRLRRLFLNLLLLSGTRRLSTQGEAAVPTLQPTLPIATVPPTLAPSSTPSPAATLAATVAPTALPTTSVPTALPTLLPTLRPSPSKTSTPLPAPILPTRVPTATPRPTPRPSPAPPPPLPNPTPRRMAAPLVPIAVPGLPALIPAPSVEVPAEKPVSSAGIRHSAAVRPTVLMSGAPTPQPRRPAAQAVAVAPARPAVDVGETVKNALGCLESAPQPFADGGVYLGFCLKHAARIQVSVFDSHGHTLWRSQGASFEPGSHKVYFDGRVSGDLVVPGHYLWEVRAQYRAGVAESRQSSMDRKQEDR